MSGFKDKDNILPVEEEDDVLTVEEEKKIATLKIKSKLDTELKKEVDTSINAKMINLDFNNIAASVGGLNIGDLVKQQATNWEPANFSVTRRLGLHPVVTVNNISGKKAWVILSPAPIVSISSVGLEKVGQVSLSSIGDYKCQQSAILDNSSREFELDNSQIYYSAFFDCDGKWRTPFKNRKINTRKYNINLLERHVDEAVDSNFIPNN